MTLLISIAVICTVAFVFFLLGRETEKRRAIRLRWESLLKQRDDYSLSVLPLVRQAQEDTAEMMREMEFYGEANQVVNARGGNS